MSGWVVAVGFALALFGGYVGYAWFARHFRGEPNDPQGAESAIYLLVGGGVALMALLSLVAWQLLEWLRLP